MVKYIWHNCQVNLEHCQIMQITILHYKSIFEPRHEISNNVVCGTSRDSDQPARMRSLIRAFASPFSIL